MKDGRMVIRQGHTRNHFFRRLNAYKLLLVMLIPALAYFVLYRYIPMYGTILAFKKYDYSLGILGSSWDGLSNFQYLFQSGKLATLLLNTVLYNLTFIFVATIFQVALSVILSEITGKLYKKFCQTALFLPYFISWVAVGAIVYNLLNYNYGFVNTVIGALGGNPVNFYTNAGFWPFILVAVNTWKGVGYGTVVYMAAIAGIDAEIYEAGQIDGANIIQRIRHITLPNLVPTIITLTLLALGSVFRGNFQLFWNLIGRNGLLYSTTDVIDTYVYRSLMSGIDMGMTAAAGLIQSILCFVMIMVVNYIVKKISAENALF